MISRSDMIVTVILILLVCLFAGSIESNLRELFSDPNWMDNDKDNDK